MTVRIPERLWLAGMLAWLGLLSVACLLPVTGPDAPLPAYLDKLVHGLIFAGGGFWLALRLPQLWGVLMLALLGLLIEALQLLIPYRGAEALDWLADIAGALAGWALARAGREWIRV